MRSDIPNSTKIEKKAITQLDLYLEDSQVIDPFVREKDKEPIWDGHLYLYKDRIFDNAHLVDRVSVQVKGHEVDAIKEKDFKYRMEKCELDAFLNDPVVYIVCQIQRGSKGRKLFYRCMLPEYIKHIRRGKESQGSFSVPMKPMPERCEDFETILQSFTIDRRRQMQFAHSQSMTMEDAKKRGILQFSLSTPFKPMSQMRALQYISSQPTFLYANLDSKYDVTIPIEGGEFNLVFQKKDDVEVKVGDRVFYHSISSVIKEGIIQINVANAITITIRDEDDISNTSIQLHCKSDELKERIKEGELLLAIHKEHNLVIGDYSFEAYIENIGDVDYLERQLAYWKEVDELMTRLHVRKSFLISKVTKEQDKVLKALVRAILHNEAVNVTPVETGIRVITIADIRLLVWCSSNQKSGRTVIGDFFDQRVELGYPRGNEIINASLFSYLRTGYLWNRIDNIPYERQIESYIKLPTKRSYVCEVANGDVLAMIMSADKIEKKDKTRYEELLKYAYELCEWLENEDEETKSIHYLNKLQIDKRRRDLNDEENKWLRSLLDDSSKDNSIKLGAAALLGDKEEFERYKSQMPKKDFKYMRSQPIAKFFPK